MPRPARNAVVLAGLALALAGCWTLTARLDHLSGGEDEGDAPPARADASADGRAPTGGDAGERPPPRDAGFCERELAAPSDAATTTCFDYDGIEASSIERMAFGGVTVAIEPGPRSSLAISFPALPSTAGGGAHEIPTPEIARRVDIAFDARAEGAVADLPELAQLGGFIRSDVYTLLIYEASHARAAVLEQDQRDGGLVNVELKGYLPADLGDWRRIELSIDFDAGRIRWRVGGGPSEDVVLEMPVTGAGVAYVGSRYVAGTTAPFTLRFDNVVVRTF